MIDEKYTKKANTYILKEVLKINPKVSSKITYDQAFVILMDEWNMDIGITANDISVKCDIFRDDNIIETFIWNNPDAYKSDTAEFNFTFIYKTILEHIIKKKLYKRPKISKRKSKDI